MSLIMHYEAHTADSGGSKWEKNSSTTFPLAITYLLIAVNVYIRWHPRYILKSLRMHLVKESKAKDIDKEVRLLHEYEVAVWSHY